LNSNWNLRIWLDSKVTMMIKIQMKDLKSREVIALPPYRNLIPRFRGEENPRWRIGTGYLNQREEDQDSGSEECWSCGAFFMMNDHRWWRTRSEKHEGLEGLFQWRVLFGFDSGLGSLISRVFGLRFGCRKKILIRNWTAQRSRLAFLSC
jgi:hypothetical protein